jgi:hypothetical protein
MSLSEYLPTASTYDRLLGSIPQSVRDVMNQPSLANQVANGLGRQFTCSGLQGVCNFQFEVPRHSGAEHVQFGK